MYIIGLYLYNIGSLFFFNKIKNILETSIIFFEIMMMMNA